MVQWHNRTVTLCLLNQLVLHYTIFEFKMSNIKRKAMHIEIFTDN